MRIFVANESSVLTDAQVEGWMPAFRAYANHVRAYWPRPCTLELVAPADLPAADEGWQMLFLDDSDQAGALGYHDFTPIGKPIAKIFAKTDLDNGYQPTVTFTHELAEMLADPWCSELFQISPTRLLAKENADPVEADALAYTVTPTHGQPVLCSDFVTPAWFIPGHPGPVYDHARHCTKPLQILEGGYMSVFVSGGGWTQVDHLGADVPMDAKGATSRPARYARPRPDATFPS